MSEETPKKMTVREVLEKVGTDRTYEYLRNELGIEGILERVGHDAIFDYLFDELRTAGILDKMTSDLAIKREKFLEAGETEQSAKASRMHQILVDAAKRAKLIK